MEVFKVPTIVGLGDLPIETKPLNPNEQLLPFTMAVPPSLAIMPSVQQIVELSMTFTKPLFNTCTPLPPWLKCSHDSIVIERRGPSTKSPFTYIVPPASYAVDTVGIVVV